MRSTFMGLETARRGLFTQQSALYTTGQNISNANTPGYSRQRINFSSTSPYPSIGIDQVKMPGLMGTGVEAGSVQRIRESFLDVQYRTETTKLGYYSGLSSSLTKIEDIMNEPSESGLQNTLDKFWSSLQDLAGNTENTGARDVVAANGQMVAETINYYYNSLTSIQGDLGNEVGVKVDEINSLLSNINSLNEQIASVEPNGFLPNDLYDSRDLLVDQLSSMVNIKVTSVKPNDYGNSSPIAEGLYNIELVQKNGNSYKPPINLIPVTKVSGIMGINKLEISFVDDNTSSTDGLVESIKIGNTTKSVEDLALSGELGGLIESYGYKSNSGEAKGYYPELLTKLNNMTLAFAQEFNAVHKQGHTLGDVQPAGDFFDILDAKNPAKTIEVNKDILEDPSLIAAGGTSGNSGDNENAHALSEIRTKSFSKYITKASLPSGMTGTFDSYYAGIIGKLGVDSQSAAKNATNSQTLADSVDLNRQSVSAVSLDEEMTNLVKYQQAYNGSARMITVIDEMLDKIINGMGTGGR